MRRLFLFLFMQSVSLLMYGQNYSNTALDRAIEKADSFFMCFKTISKEKQGENVMRTVLNLMENYFVFFPEQSAPNEFNELGYPNDHKHGISVSRYVMFYREMFNEERFCNMSFDYAILRDKCSVIKGLEFMEHNATVHFAKIVAHKVYSLQDTVLKTFSDTLIFNLDNMRICQWTNDSHTLSAGQQVQLMHEHIDKGIKYGDSKGTNHVQNYISRKKRKGEI